MEMISRETFIGASQDTKDQILFDFLVGLGNTQELILKKFDTQKIACDARIGSLENAALRNRAVAAGTGATSGVLGGFIAVLTKPFFGGGS